MSIATEITRLTNAKASIKTAIEGKGVTVPSTTKLDGYADLIGQITGGEYDAEAIPNSDGTYNLAITDAQGGGGSQGYTVTFPTFWNYHTIAKIIFFDGTEQQFTYDKVTSFTANNVIGIYFMTQSNDGFVSFKTDKSFIMNYQIEGTSIYHYGYSSQQETDEGHLSGMFIPVTDTNIEEMYFYS